MTQHSGIKPTGAGKSSFGLIDTAKFFQELDLKEDIAFLDVACGRGAYSLAAADVIGDNGQIYAVDLWEEGIFSLRKEAESKGIQNLAAFVSDVAQNIPVEDDCADVCLMATVLHDLVAQRVGIAVVLDAPRGAIAATGRAQRAERRPGARQTIAARR